MDRQALLERVQAIPTWFYEMDLGHGVITPGAGNREALRARAEIYFGMGIEGKSVLDVGAWDGFYSFEAERRGAARVLAADKFCWTGPTAKAGFDLAHEALASRVESSVLDIDETTAANVGHFDIVLFNGIVYHIVDPIHAIIEMSKIATGMLSVETFMDMSETDRPCMVFYRGETAKPGFPQNGWGVNSHLMRALLGYLGFETILEFPTPDAPTQRSIFLAFKPGHPFKAFVERHRAFDRPPLVAMQPQRSEPLAPPLADIIGWGEISRLAARRLRRSLAPN